MLEKFEIFSNYTLSFRYKGSQNDENEAAEYKEHVLRKRSQVIIPEKSQSVFSNVRKTSCKIRQLKNLRSNTPIHDY